MFSKKNYWVGFVRGNTGVLEPIERVLEILFGVIMVLTFTCSIGVVTAGKEDIKTMLWAALGCNTAWGLIDALMYLMTILYERGRGIRGLRKLKETTDEKESEELIRDGISSVVGSVMTSAQLKDIRQSLLELSEPPRRSFLTRNDFRNAFLIFLLVFCSTFPLVIPFLLTDDPVLALRISNSIAICFLFLTGYFLGKSTGYYPFLMGLTLSVLGVLVVFLTIQLGG